MFCKYCGEENSDDSLFCKKCGKKLETDRCPACGAEVPAGAQFCVKCGAKVGENVAEPEETEEQLSPRAKLFNILSAVAGIAVAAFALVFVFFTGFADSMGTVYVGNRNEALFVSENRDIYYYFGDVYKTITETMSTLAEGSFSPKANYHSYESSLYFPAVFGTVISAALLVAVTAFSIIAIVGCAKRLSHGKTKGGTGFAFAAFGAYLAGALAICALNSFSYTSVGTASYSTVTYTQNVTLNGATISGLVICGVFALASAGFAAAVKGKKLFNMGNCAQLILSAVKFAAVMAAIALSCGAVIVMKEAASSANVIAGGAMYYQRLFASNFLGSLTQDRSTMLNTAVICEELAFVVTIAGAAVGAVYAARVLAAFTDGKTKKNMLAYPIIVAVCSALALALSIGGAKNFCDLYNDMGIKDVPSFAYGGMIAALILSAITLGAEIAFAAVASAKHAASGTRDGE